MIMTPRVLLPVWPTFIKQNSPAWFTDKPRLFPFKSGGAMTLDTVMWRDRKGRMWTVPKGFVTDGMSYPFFMAWFLDKYDKSTIRTAIVHDCHYCLYDYCHDWLDERRNFDRDLLDGLLIDRPRWARVDYIGVSFGGYSVWTHKSHEDLVEHWLEVVDYPTQLDAWIQGVVDSERKINYTKHNGVET